MDMNFTEILACLVNRSDLNAVQSTYVANSMLEGELTDVQIAAFLSALQAKGVSALELSAFVSVMRAKALQISPKVNFTVDTCGTGGDGLHTFNISTTVAFVVAACGLPVAKHGNRAASSKSGSADVLKSLGVDIEMSPETVAKAIETIGIGFLFAPQYHPAMRHVAAVRQELKIRTIFNLMGPLLNPASPNYQVVGVYDPAIMDIYIETMESLGFARAMVVHGQGMDELTVTGTSQVRELDEGRILTYEIKPEDFALKRSSLDELRGGSPEDNAQILKNILSGQERGAKRDIVLLNAAAVLKVAGQVASWQSGIEVAAEAIDSGRAMGKLESLVGF